MRSKTSSSGFSLIETLIAMTILAMVVAGTLGLFTFALHRTFGGRNLTAATALARTAIEQIDRPAAWELLDASPDATMAEKAWTRMRVSGATEESASETSGARHSFRNGLRDAFLDAALPFGEGDAHASELRVRVESIPEGSPFAGASMLRISVRVRWTERGVRSRRVELETLQMPRREVP